MIFISYTKTDSYYEFVGENGQKLIYPVNTIILTDDESGFIAVKNIASRQVVGLTRKPKPIPKAILTLNDSSTVTIEDDGTTVLTRAEISAYSTSLISVEIGRVVTEIGNNAFYNFKNMSACTIPDNVTTIGQQAFSHCYGLSSVTIPNSVTSIDNSAFQNCRSLTSLTIPDSVTSIGSSAFKSCTGLTSINIPTGVTSIGQQTFRDCSSLTSIEIPSGVTSIGDAAFKSCTGLISITCLVTTPPTLVPYRGVYENFLYTNDCSILVPAASVDTYKAAEGWSDYADRITAIV